MVEQVSAKANWKIQTARNATPVDSYVAGAPLQEEPVIADEAVAVGEHESKTDGVEENSAKTGVHYAFHEHVDGFTGATETGFQHGEADLHAEHQEGGDQGPGGVHRVDHVGRFDLRRAV